MNCTVITTLICALFRFGCGQDDQSSMKAGNQDVNHSNFGPPPPTNMTTSNIRHQRMISDAGLPFCLVPSQPLNGRWKLHRSFCDHDLDCDIPQGISLQSGSQLVYNCDPGFRAQGNTDVYCVAKGNWSPIPSCIEIKCPGLDSESKKARCDRFGETVDCDSPVFIKTRAEVSCRPGYKKDTKSLLEQGETMTCNVDGKWEPDPIRCTPVCGVSVSSQSSPLIIGGATVQITSFPWHATLYVKKNSSNDTSKEFLCSATIIQTNRLLTAAHCVYDEVTGTTVNPETLFVTTGNTNRAYDYPQHNPSIVQKRPVKNVYAHCDYKGHENFYLGDIALIELKQPFVLSSIVLPACLDLDGDSEQILEPGALGRMPGFGKTGRGEFSDTLQSVTVPYIPYTDCLRLAIPASADFLAKDKFCGGFQNGTAICSDNSGGGVVFKQNKLSYLMGILSVQISDTPNNGELTCNGNSLSLYTRVSTYMAWILKMIYHLERNGVAPSCDTNSSEPIETTNPIPKPAPTPPSTNIQVSSSVENLPCTVPPQPENGEWKFHGSLCGNNTDCKIPQGAILRPGSQLIYSCASGYRARGNTVVFCGDNGSWSEIPVCIEVKCSSLNSVSTMVSCSRFGKWVSCDSPMLEKTRAELSCRLGYKKDTVFTATRKDVVNCDENGKWKPDPIRCVPVCGVAITHQTPYSVGGTPANIGDFPWHATLYLQTKSSEGIKKEFICGATIIHSNFVLTAAHCVYDERTRTTVDPWNLSVMTGNTFRDYDSKWHDPHTVRKTGVKNVYTHSNYYALLGNYVSDIALLELQQPFNFSGILLPACLDLEGYSEQILEPDVYGKVAGFGRTVSGSFSAILQTLKMPYISYRKCRASKNADQNEYFISNDKFCAGYTNGTALCDGDSGGGLVFQKNDLWYVLGIVSVGLGADLTNGERTCNRYSFTLFTKVSTYLNWIQDVISNPERFNSCHNSRQRCYRS